MTTRLFRQEVIEAGRDRLTGTVVAAVPPGSRLYTAVLAGAAALLIVLLALGQYASRVQVKGVVAQASGIAHVAAPSPGLVREVYVEEGAEVAAGAPLVALSLAVGRDAGGEGLSGRLAELERQDAALARQQALASSLGASDASGIAQQKTGLIASITSLERQRSLVSGQIALAEANHRRAVRLAEEGAGTQRQVEESRGELLSQRLELERLAERLATQRETLRGLDTQIASRRIDSEQSQAEIVAQRAALADQRAALLRLDRLVLTAPVGGVVGDIAARTGQSAEAGAPLVTIRPPAGRTEVQLYAPSRAIGFVKPGQDVRLMFDAFPYQRYGAGRGVVRWVSEVPIDPRSLDPGLGITEPVFRIRVDLQQGPASGGGAAEQALRPGMTLSANLLLERRRLWEVFLDPVLRAMRK
ncbi:HlyD family efflux transporter periplasmic adaptor subunit [Sphingomonas parva]|uniref:HlyD family efflux transporter periplasmic adaptor subunit n=1 Tax=Sphingomonas parva TaxID=2555898 RepID=A0A4Y8ZVK8_9SPHN|nr:HlyD family efflux transporter periplasmic adaptor subunit [Sphingomonas parva]TFI59165.1 HlyD family efflux transporter periplasmic adaptor subunit [Sphingomonas parva]